MIEGSASRTAEEQASIRAIESLMPPERRVCYDPFAVVFLDERFRRRYALCQKNKLMRTLWIWSLRRDPGGTRAEAVARTRYIDDYSQACITAGVQQVVILGAGYDSRAYRLPSFKNVKVFEVDHPDTQKTKIAIMKRVSQQLPSWVTFIPVDFEKEKLDEKLLKGGYSRDLRTLFIWEGVAMYLTAESVDKTLSFVAINSSPGSSIVFNYWHRSAADGKSEDRWAKVLKKRSQELGEPIKFEIDGSDIESFLVARGFSEVNRITASALTQLCFKGPNSNRKACSFMEMVNAKVGRPK